MTTPGRPPWRLGALVLGALVAPLVVAAVALRTPHWYPTLDLAMTELRVRDVGTSHTPLIGLPGRIGTLEEQGSHPGPLSFYALAPVYRLLGSSAWSLQVGALVLAAGAMATSLWLAARRGGPRLLAATGVVLAGLSAAYGFPVLTEPWNPYLPVLWWLAFALACWGVAERDLRLVPVAVLAGSFCAQTHLPYAGLAVGVGVGSLGLAVWGDRTRDGLRALRGPGLAGLAVAALVWAPVAIDQATVEPGNVSLLVEHFTDPPEEPIGMTEGLHVVLVHLDLRPLVSPFAGDAGTLVDRSYDPDGPVGPGLVLLAAWAGSAIVAWRRGLRRVVQLDLVVAGALVLGVVSTSNIFGKVWYYLTLWAWGLAALMVLAVGATVAHVVDTARPSPARWRASLTALVLVVVASSLHLAWQARDAEVSEPTLSRGLGLVVGPTEDALRAGAGDATGVDGRYVVTWSDPLHIGSQGYGLVSELERDGFDVGVRDFAKAPVTRHRVIPPDDVTAVVHFATGGAIERWRTKPGVVEVVHVDPRSPAEQVDYERTEVALIESLRADGLDDIADRIATDVFGASLDPRLDAVQRARFDRLIALGLPISVFVAPPDVDPF